MSQSKQTTNELGSLDLNLLVTLDVLLEIRSVTATAKRVGVTQSAVSHRLARLRELFGDPLLVSAGDDLVLTSKAEELQAPLRAALGELRDAVFPSEALDPSSTNRSFAFAASDLAELGFLPALLNHLARVAPGIGIRMLGRSFVTGDALADGKVDFAIAPGQGMVPGVSLDETRGVRQRLLTTDGFSVLACERHPRLKGRLTLKRYLAEDHILVSPQGGPRGLVDGVLARQGKSRRVAVQVASFLSAPFLLPGTGRLLTCPESLAATAAAPLGLRVFKPPIELPSTKLFLYWHERTHNDPGHRWLRDEMLALTAAEGR